MTYGIPKLQCSLEGVVMHVLAINGSPRVGGNTDILLDKVLEGAKSAGAEIEKIMLNKLKFSGCQECANVPDDGNCIVQDDMQPLFRKISEADVVVAASPIFFGSISAQTKKMVDRYQCFWRVRFMLKKKLPVKKKKGIFLCVEASDRKDFQDNAKAIIKNFFVAIGASYDGEIFCQGIDEKGKILEHKDILEKAFNLGKKIGK